MNDARSSCPPGTALPMAASLEQVVLPHLDAAYRLARWLTRNEQDAEDVVQDALLRALQYFPSFTGGNGRAWFLRIVRNTCSSWRVARIRASTDLFDEERHVTFRQLSDPEASLIHSDNVTLIERAMSALPDRARRLLVLRELEGLSYRELADLMAIPMGSVMSGLSRARQAFRVAIDSRSAHANGRALASVRSAVGARTGRAEAVPREDR